MKIECPCCSKIIEVDDRDIMSYIGRKGGQARSEAKRAAVTKSAALPRPGGRKCLK